MTAVAMVDEYIDALLETGERRFMAWELAEWAGVYTGQASTALQVHKQAQRRTRPSRRPRHVLERNGMGRASVWMVTQPRDAERILQRSLSENTHRFVVDVTCRVRPTAMRNPRIRRRVEVTERAIAREISNMLDQVDLIFDEQEMLINGQR